MDQGISDHERFARLQLFRSRGVGPLTYRQLIEKTGSGEEAVRALPDLARKAGRSTVVLADASSVSGEMRAGERLSARLLTLGEPGYPAALAAIADAPPALWLIGDAALLERTSISIVGARNASAAGRAFARTLAQDLGAAGNVVVSGMARGIDAAAHEAALDTGTVAVLAGGPDSVYPPEHARLYAAIRERGLIVSEQPIGMTARARDFPKRNRIVSGLSLGVVVVEAAERSGTLITARLASEQGRDVFAVPGSPMDPRCKGTNGLLRKGAIMTESAEDILSELDMRWKPGALEEPPPGDWSDDADPSLAQELREEIIGLLSFVPVHRDTLIAETGAPSSAVAMALLDLVLEGAVLEEIGGRYALAEDSGGR